MWQIDSYADFIMCQIQMKIQKGNFKICSNISLFAFRKSKVEHCPARQGKGTKGNNSANTEDEVMVIVHALPLIALDHCMKLY
jgi:hypothetical protein